MLKGLVVLLLGFLVGLAGNLVAAWIKQQDVWSNLFTPTWLLVGVLLMLVILVLLESERASTWNWRWHRFWYLRELTRHPRLHRWEAETSYARLRLLQRRVGFAGLEVISDGERQDLISVLRDLIAGRLSGSRRTLVVGEPGSGKTTGLERLALELARDGARRLGFGRLIPIFTPLGRFQTGELLAYVSKTMKEAVRGRSGKILSKGIEALLEKGRVALLFDALDEALGERREIVLSELEQLLDSQAYSHVPMVITTRTREDPGGRLGDLQSYVIQDLNDEAVQAFIHARIQPGSSEKQIWQQLKDFGLLEPGGLGRNPFWLGLIIDGGLFSGKKGQILNAAVDKLLTREWEKPEADRAWERVLPTDEQLEQTMHGLAWLGYRMSVGGEMTVDRDKALAELEDYLQRSVGADRLRLRPQDILGLGSDAQILAYEPGPVTFRHRLLQEFMTAWGLMLEEALLTPELLQQMAKPGGSSWREVIALLAGVSGDATSLVSRVLCCQEGVSGESEQLAYLFIALICLYEAAEVGNDVQNQVFEALSRLSYHQAADVIESTLGSLQEMSIEVRTLLANIFDSSDESVHSWAIGFLGQYLTKLPYDQAADVIESTFGSLEGMSVELETFLVNTLNSPDESVHSWGVGFLNQYQCPITITGQDGASMAFIPAGEFLMGHQDKRHMHPVSFDYLDSFCREVSSVYLDAFCIDKYEVTNARYAKFLNEYGKNTDAAGHMLVDIDSEDCLIEKVGDAYRPEAGYENHPVVAVSWYGAATYAQFYGKRLPTEAEWEKAARGGLVGKRYPWGDYITHAHANYFGTGGRDVWERTSPVGSFLPNGYGLYDMAGNVWEWCAEGPDSGDFRVLRGGSWFTSPSTLRVAYGFYWFAGSTHGNFGFRCAGPKVTP